MRTKLNLTATLKTNQNTASWVDHHDHAERNNDSNSDANDNTEHENTYTQ